MSGINFFPQIRRYRRAELAWVPSQVLLWLAVLGLAIAVARLPLYLAAALVVGGGFATLVLVRPVWALVLLPFAVPFGSLADVQLGPAMVGGTELLLGLFFVAWLARGVARREVRVRWAPLLLPFGLWIAAQALSLLGSLSLAASLKELIKWGEMAALYLIAAQELRRRDVALVIAATLLAGALSGAHGLLQSLLRIGPEGFLFPLAGRLWLRAYGTFEQPNPYAGYLGVTLPLAYGIAVSLLDSRFASDESEESRAFSSLGLGSGIVTRGVVLGYVILTGAFVTLGLLLSLSRGAWIGAAAAALGVSILVSRRALVASSIAAIGGALFLALGGLERLPAALRERATDFLPYLGLVDIRRVEITDANFAIIERLAHWWAAAGMFSDRPWLGVGIGNYAAVYPAYALPRWEDPLGHAHNYYLNMAAETGLVGLAAYLLLWIAALALTFRAVRRTTGLWRGVAVGCLGAFIHLAVHNFFDNLYVQGIYLQIALFLAIVALLARPHSQEEHFRRT